MLMARFVLTLSNDVRNSSSTLVCPTESTESRNRNSDSTERVTVSAMTQSWQFHSRNRKKRFTCNANWVHNFASGIRFNWTFGWINKRTSRTFHTRNQNQPASPTESQNVARWNHLHAWHVSADCHHVKLQIPTPNEKPLNPLGHWHHLACRSNQNMSCSPVPQKMEQLSASHNYRYTSARIWRHWHHQQSAQQNEASEVWHVCSKFYHWGLRGQPGPWSSSHRWSTLVDLHHLNRCLNLSMTQLILTGHSCHLHHQDYHGHHTRRNVWGCSVSTLLKWHHHRKKEIHLQGPCRLVWTRRPTWDPLPGSWKMHWTNVSYICFYPVSSKLMQQIEQPHPSYWHLTTSEIWANLDWKNVNGWQWTLLQSDAKQVLQRDVNIPKHSCHQGSHGNPPISSMICPRWLSPSMKAPLLLQSA